MGNCKVLPLSSFTSTPDRLREEHFDLVTELNLDLPMVAFIDTSHLTMFFIVFFVIFSCQVNASLLDPVLISKELQTFARDALGVEEMQVYLGRLQYHRQTMTGDDVLPSLAAKLTDKLKTRFAVTQRLRKAVEDSYNRASNPRPVTECCKADKSKLIYDVRFRSEVDLNNFCAQISGAASPSLIHLDEKVLLEMKAISKTHPFIKWQYFGSEEGMLTNFPVYYNKDCSKYDPRYRPFYVETATPEAKDVVLVIDTSASMNGDKLIIAREAANTVLDTMNPKDHVGIVSFNSEVSTPGIIGEKRVCYSQRLARATPENIRYLKKYVGGIFSFGETQYRLAFEKAFTLLKGTASEDAGKVKKKVILFLTDGAPSDGKTAIFQTIRDRNSELNNSVVILTFGLGGVDQETKSILQDIALQNTAKYGISSNVSSADITKGRFIPVEDIKTLRTKMALYYNLFAAGKQLDRPVVSVPYVDAFGTGLLVSITLPCYHKGKFIGVTGTDINIEDLTSDISFLNEGHSVYAYLTSKSGRTVVHPLLPAPNDVYGDPVYLDIRTLEPDPEFNDVFASMIAGGSGSKTFVTKRFLPRGGSIQEGVQERNVKSMYCWIQLDGTEFTLGVVVPVGYAKERLKALEIPKGYSFKYHRIDVDLPPNPCLHFGKVVTKDTTVVKFAPEAFVDPYEYIGVNETIIEVKKLHDFMMGKTTQSEYPKLRPDIRDTVIATWTAEKLWLRDKTELTQYLAWRYVGTANGVFRATPGAVEQKSYDPRRRPWYYAAVSHSGFLTLTTPYLDMGGAGEVITASRSLYRGESTDNVLGVMGADFTLRYFYRLLTKVYPKCSDEKTYTCFVMDDSGFLIMHPQFMLPSAKASDVEHVHITQKEKLIAVDLINRGFLKRRQCRNVASIGNQSFYEIHLPPGGFNALQKDQGCKYELNQITGTNGYLGVVVRDSLCVPSSCSCSSDNKCFPLPGLECECPCTSPLEFFYCRSQFPNSSLPLCPTFAPSGQPNANPSKSQTICLNKCFDPHCNMRNSSQWCDGIVSCYWCEKDQNGSPLTKPYCASSERCFRGKESGAKIDEAKCVSSTIRPSTKQPGLSAAATVGIALGCTIPFILLIIALLFLAMKRYRHSANPPMKKGKSESMHNIASSPGISHVPDVLSTSMLNHDFRVYENPDDVNCSQEGPTAVGQLQRQNAVDVPNNQLNFVNVGRQPSLPEKQRKISIQSDQAPPVPNTRRPSNVIPSRLRSLTDPIQPPPVPSTRRPSQCHTTAPNMSSFRSLSADSPIQPTHFTKTGPQVGFLGGDHPPALAPRTKRSSNDSFSESRSDFPSMRSISCPKDGLYNNIPPISESREDLITDNNEDNVDADGYVKCVYSGEDPQFV